MALFWTPRILLDLIISSAADPIPSHLRSTCSLLSSCSYCIHPPQAGPPRAIDHKAKDSTETREGTDINRFKFASTAITYLDQVVFSPYVTSGHN